MITGCSSLPRWLKKRTPPVGAGLKVSQFLKKTGLKTICQSARCPNRLECFGQGTATFLILGDVCTRACRFCAMASGQPRSPEPDEPMRVARAAQVMGLKHIVVTSVTRDDLPDGGSHQFVRTIDAVRKTMPASTIEVLTPDFQGSAEAVKAVVKAQPHIFNHNLETVPRLYSTVRPRADYKRSLGLLRLVKHLAPEMVTKSGMMLGLGEEESEVIQVLRDLRTIDCAMVTLGQYLRPRRHSRNLEVVRFILPDEFRRYQEIGKELGFAAVAAGPYVRSSYNAQEFFNQITTPTPLSHP